MKKYQFFILSMITILSTQLSASLIEIPHNGKFIDMQNVGVLARREERLKRLLESDCIGNADKLANLKLCLGQERIRFAQKQAEIIQARENKENVINRVADQKESIAYLGLLEEAIAAIIQQEFEFEGWL